MNQKRKLTNRNYPEFKITLIYCALGILWIVFSDQFVETLNTVSGINRESIQTYKGIGYVILTALFLFFLIKRSSIKQYTIQKKIEQSQIEYSHLIENQNNLIVKVDNKGRFLYVNNTYCDFFGKKKEDLLGHSFVALVHEDDRHGTTESMESLHKPPYKAHVEQRVMTPKGMRWLSWNDNAIVDKNNKIVEIIGIGQDITEHKLQDQKLADSEKKYRQLFELSKDPILILEDDTYIDCNQATIDLLGYSHKKDIRGKKLWDLSPLNQEDGQSSKDKTAKIIKDTLRYKYQRFEWQHIKANGEPVWVEVALTSMQKKETNVFYTLWRDITEKKTFEKALEKSQKDFNMIAENTSDFIIITDDNLVAKYVSPSVINILGYTADEISNHNILDFIYESDLKHVKQLILKDRKTNTKTSTYTYRVLNKEGIYHWIELSIQRIYKNDHDLEYSVCIGREVSERIKYQEDLRNALKKAEESDRLKSAFLANMGHEIRTPLNGIIGFSEILASDEELDLETRMSYSNIISKSGTQLLNIISDILDISRIESNQIELEKTQIFPNHLFKDMQEIFEEDIIQKGLDFRINEPKKNEDTLVFNGDYQRVRQIFANLLNNAQKFTSKGYIEIGLYKQQDIWAFYVKDTGLGIKTNFQDEIFKRFTQENWSHATKFGGTGLGLSISKSLVELMGGQIWLESKYGKGSTFYFSLPQTELS